MIFFKNLWRFKSKVFNKKKIIINKEIDFGSLQANKFFISQLKSSKFYFEYGSGSSTIYANFLKKKFISIELDKIFYNEIKKKIKSKKITYINIGPVGEFSYPIFFFKDKIENYIKSINKYLLKKKHPDTILIDGRFRVACCLNILSIIKNNNIKLNIIIDDFKDRPYYKILKKYFIVKMFGRMALLTKKNKFKFSNKILDKYTTDPR